MNLLNGVLTKGLGVDLPACKTLITMHFNLFTIDVTTTTSIPIGGSHPLAPGEFKNFYQPVDPTSFPGDIDMSLVDHPIFVDDLKDVKQVVAVKIKFGEREIEKEFAVPIRRAKMIVKVANMVNSTKSRMSVAINNIREIKNKLTAKISRLRSKK